MRRAKSSLSLIVLFLLFLILPLLLFLLPDKAFSEQENRYLAQRPEWRLSRVFDGTFARDMEKYLADQFPGRNGWIQAKASADFFLGKKESGGVYIGRKNRLFEQKAITSQELLLKNVRIMADLAADLAQYDITAIFLPVYSAATLYPEQLPAFALVYDEIEAMALLQESLPFLVVDTLAALRAAPNKDQLYFQTDHHWSQAGAFLAYEEFLAEKGFPMPAWTNETASRRPFFGTLFSKAPLPWLQGDDLLIWQSPALQTVSVQFPETGAEAVSPYLWENLQKKDQYTVFLGGNFGQVRLHNPQAPVNGHVMVLKDSFAHPFLPLLAAHYQDITSIDLRYFHPPLREYAVANSVTEVLFLYNITWFAGDENFIYAQY